MDLENEKNETRGKYLELADQVSCLSRRDFLFISGVLAAASPLADSWATTDSPLIIIENANGIVLGDPTKCVGCRRCELACSEFNDGKASPTISRIKISRNMNFGPGGARNGQNGQGLWGNGLVIQDICNQCAHPVPCANACPNDAIVLSKVTKARVVDPERCVGCRMCLKACPWEMMSFDSETEKATKCFLCDGNPKCVAACPAEALSYVSWRDLTHISTPRIAPSAVVPLEKSQSCNDCHKK